MNATYRPSGEIDSIWSPLWALLCVPADSVADEDVTERVGVSGHEVRGVAPERDVAAVARDRGNVVGAVDLRASGIDAHALGRAAHAVEHEHVPVPVRVRGHEIRGLAFEGNVAAVGGDRGGVAAVAIPLHAGGVD